MADSNPKTITVFTTVPWDQALAVLRYRAPAQMLEWNLIPGKENKEDIFPERVDQADAILIQRDFARFYDRYVEIVHRARSLGKPIVYEVDDLLFDIPSTHPNKDDYVDVTGGVLLSLFDADTVLVSSLGLQKNIQAITPRPVEVWPNYLPDEYWRLDQNPNLAQPEKVVIGYMGSTTHQPDVEVLGGVLAEILAKYAGHIEIHFWHCPPPEVILGHPEVKHFPFDYPVYEQFAAEFPQQQAEIWLAPLQDHSFNRCKSTIKFWEYAAVGGAAIFQAISPYTEIVVSGKNGLLANTPDEWLDATSQLIEQPEQRQNLAQAARSQLLAHGYLSEHIHEWQTLWQKIMFSPQQTLLPVEAESMANAFRGIQARSLERDQEVIHLLNEIETRDREYLPKVNQLNDILESRSWKLIQKTQKIRGIAKSND